MHEISDVYKAQSVVFELIQFLTNFNDVSFFLLTSKIIKDARKCLENPEMFAILSNPIKKNVRMSSETLPNIHKSTSIVLLHRCVSMSIRIRFCNVNDKPCPIQARIKRYLKALF